MSQLPKQAAITKIYLGLVKKVSQKNLLKSFVRFHIFLKNSVTTFAFELTKIVLKTPKKIGTLDESVTKENTFESNSEDSSF